MATDSTPGTTTQNPAPRPTTPPSSTPQAVTGSEATGERGDAAGTTARTLGGETVAQEGGLSAVTPTLPGSTDQDTPAARARQEEEKLRRENPDTVIYRTADGSLGGQDFNVGAKKADAASED